MEKGISTELRWTFQYIHNFRLRWKSNPIPVSKIVGRMLGRCWTNSKILGEYWVNVSPMYYAAWDVPLWLTDRMCDTWISINHLIDMMISPIFRDAARYEFKHEILDNSASSFGGEKITKTRRISIICRSPPTATATVNWRPSNRTQSVC